MSSELVAVIVGGSIALAGAVLAQLFSWLQLRSTRAFELRQAVYLDAAVAMANSLEFFSSVSNLEIDDVDLASLIRPTSAAMFKIHIVGTPATIAALAEANYQLTAAAASLASRRAHLRAVIQSATPNQVSASEEINRLRTELFVEAMQCNLQYQRHLSELNVAARRELGLPLNESEYRSANLKAEERIVAAIDSALERLQSMRPN